MEVKSSDLVKANEALQAVLREPERAEQEVRLLLSIIDAVCGAEEFNDAIRATLQQVCDATGWDCAEAWLPSPDHSVLECAPVWYCRVVECVEVFRALSEGSTCAPGVGLVGRVWVAKEPEWVRDVSAESETRFIRARIAREAGLKAALAVPIMAGEEVLAVLVFFMLEARKRDQRLVEIVSAAAAHLGSVIRHKQADQALKESRELLGAIMDNSSRVIYLKDLQGRYLLINREYERLFHVNRDEIKGKTDHDLVSKEAADAFRGNDLKVAEAGVPMEFEEVVGQDDGIHTYLSNKFPMFNAAGRCYAVCGISTDITEQKAAEKEIREERDELEAEVQRRTKALANTVKDLHEEIVERKKAESRLQESERRLSTLMSSLPGIAYRCRNDRSRTMEFVSRGSRDLTGYWPSELIENRMVAFGELVHPDDRNRVWEEVQEALREQKPFQLVYRIATARREERWVWEQGRGVYDSGENLEALEGFITDITERRQATEALRRTEAELRRVMDSVSDYLWSAEVDRRGRLTYRYYSPVVEKITGRPPEFYMQGPERWLSTIYPEDLPQVEKAYRRIKTEQSDHEEAEYRIVLPDGTIRWVRDSANAKRLEDGTSWLDGVVSDITERKRAETWLHRLIETTQDAVVSTDEHGLIALFNPAAERVFGYSRAEVLGNHVKMLMVEPYASEHDGYIARYKQTVGWGPLCTVRSVEGRRKNREVFPIELSVTALETGGEIRYVAFIRDVSEKTKMQARLIESERLAAIGAATAAFAHEIGNPLNGMSMTVQLLQRRLAKVSGVGATAVDTVQKLKDEIRRLTGLLQDFSSFARRETYVFKPVSLATVAGEVFSMEEEKYRAQGIRVEQNFPANLPLVLADRDKLKQAMLNLCKNAAEAMPEGGTLKVQARDARDEVMLEITDSGAGIADGVDIFAPFTTTKPTGTGLGLMVVRQIVAGHGGTVSFTSEQGKGTTFRISLPLASL